MQSNDDYNAGVEAAAKFVADEMRLDGLEILIASLIRQHVSRPKNTPE